MRAEIEKELKQRGDEQRAKILAKFFKTGPGEYGEGDIFIGIYVPDVRKVARSYMNTSFKDVQALLKSPIHECRLVALLILTEQFKKAPAEEKTEIYTFYLKNAKSVNNWDLVDLSAHRIIGEYLQDKKKEVLYDLAKSDNLWERRIAIVATYAFIKKNNFNETVKVAELLVHDKHDLIQKAVGWMLREVGKRNQDVEEQFLKKHYKTMPRTALRYAIERFSEHRKKFYMQKD